MRDQKVMRAGMRNKEFILCGLNVAFPFLCLQREKEREKKRARGGEEILTPLLRAKETLSNKWNLLVLLF